MSKIPNNLRDPIDLLIYNFVPFISKSFDNYGPNFITSISLIFGIIGCIFFYSDDYQRAIVSFALSYIFDCVDGYHARRKNMQSKFGDMYDHLTDIIIYSIALLIFYLKYQGNKFYLLSILGLLLIINQYYLSLVENYQKFEKSPFLNVFNLKTKNPEKYMKYLRFFGCGSLQLFLFYIIYLVSNNK